ncbi:hypothetical protein ABZ454_36505 [Streptomyces sp. NPDC005803]
MFSNRALRVLPDTGEALATVCASGAQDRWPTLYAKSHWNGCAVAL